MILNAFTVFHVVLSLIGIGSGVVAIYGLTESQERSPVDGRSCSWRRRRRQALRDFSSRSTASRLPWRSASCRSSFC
jgi:hypothetical protein